MSPPSSESRAPTAGPVAAAFFLTAPLAVIAAGLVLMGAGTGALRSNWTPVSLGLTHLGTLGFLLMILMGTVYEAAPRLLGRPVPAPRLGHAVYVLILAGTVTLFWGLAGRAVWAVFASITTLALALLLFLGPALRAVFIAPLRDAPAQGTGLALASLLLAGILGLWMAHGHSGMRFPGPRGLFIQVHLTLALLGWVGGFTAALSWRLLPQAYGCTTPEPSTMRAVLGALAVGLLLPLAVLVVNAVGLLAGPRSAPTLAALGAIPAAAAVWGLHPATVLPRLARAPGPRTDGSLLLWGTGLLAAPVAGLLSVAAFVSIHPRWVVLLGWVAIWGWAGMMVHGHVEGIVRLRAGKGARREHPTRLGFALHAGSLLFGAVAILGDLDWLARGAGLLVVGTGAHLGWSLVRAPR